jgi:hypothetical protein
MPRTELHRKLEQGISGFSDLTGKIDVVVTEVRDIPVRVGSTFGSLSERLADVSAQLGLIHSAILAVGRQDLPEPTPEAFHCIRALNQVEDLVTDREFVRAENNASLERRWHDAPTQDCWRRLADDKVLMQRFQRVFRAFGSEGVPERIERYLELDQLRRDVVRYFAPPQLPASAAGGAVRSRSPKK